MNKRIRNIRIQLGLNQIELAKRLNLSQAHLSGLENGSKNITDRLISDYVREFNVNENWLRHGKGEMFIVSDNTIIAELAAEYKLSAIDKEILTHFLQMDEHTRKVITDEIVSLANKISSIEDVDPIEEEVNNYRMELEAQKKTAEQSTRYDIGEGEGS